MQGRIVHVCSCGIEYTAAQWDRLPSVGQQDMRAYGSPLLDMRNCSCGSTRSRPIATPKPRRLSEYVTHLYDSSRTRRRGILLRACRSATHGFTAPLAAFVTPAVEDCCFRETGLRILAREILDYREQQQSRKEQ
jgi:hypothetical protein